VAVQIVGIVLVRNEDAFVGRAIRNALSLCDRIHVADHMSTDGTWDVVRALAAEHETVDVRRIRNARVSHELIEGYAGTDTWVLGLDGDELYDPVGLARFRKRLLAGAHRDVFKIASNALNCVSLDLERRLAAGYLAPPSRSITKLYYLGAVDSWTGCSERLHNGEAVFRPGYGWETVANLAEHVPWEESDLRCLHCCFLPRSSRDSADGNTALGRPILDELGAHDRGLTARLLRRVRRTHEPKASAWKQEKYRRGDLVTKDVSSFFVT
jgi:glycosyltransferase involved in cell wall biosynthesis